MIAVISDVHFPSNAERQKVMETGLKKLTGIRALFICGDFTDNRKDTKPEEEMKLPEYIKKLPYPVFFIDGNHEDYIVTTYSAAAISSSYRAALPSIMSVRPALSISLFN